MNLKLKNKQVFNIFDEWSQKFVSKNDVYIHFSDSIYIGAGKSKCNIKDKSHTIEIGIAPISKSFFKRNEIIEDSDFVKIGVTMFHEIAHYMRSTEEDTPNEILLSDLSKFGNRRYYNDNWFHMPHEIDAEYTGIMTMWSHLENKYPDISDELMLNRLVERTKPNKTRYMIAIPDNGFQSKEQIDSLFDEAYDRSLVEKRNLSPEFMRSDDEIAKMFTEGNIIRMDYYPFYYKIQTAKTGQEMDVKMASLVSYMHPELQELYPSLNFEKLNPLFIFGMPIPETREELLSRIGAQSERILYSDDIEINEDESNEKEFADAIAGMSKLNNGLNK